MKDLACRCAVLHAVDEYLKDRLAWGSKWEDIVSGGWRGVFEAAMEWWMGRGLHIGGDWPEEIGEAEIKRFTMELERTEVSRRRYLDRAGDLRYEWPELRVLRKKEGEWVAWKKVIIGPKIDPLMGNSDLVLRSRWEEVYRGWDEGEMAKILGLKKLLFVGQFLKRAVQSH